MPTPLVKKLAMTSGETVSRVEHLWNRAKGIVSKEYDLSEKSPRFWKLVHGITKKMLKLQDSLDYSFADYVRLDEAAKQYITEEQQTIFTGEPSSEFLVIDIDKLKSKLSKLGITDIIINGDSELTLIASAESDLHKLSNQVDDVFGKNITALVPVKPGEFTIKFKQKILSSV